MADLSNIASKVSILFKKYGIKSITMDDIAKEMGISKKTLYQIIADKTELVRYVVKADFVEFKNRLNEVISEKIDAVLQLININKFVIEFLSALSPAVDFDLKKYYIEFYEEIKGEYFKMLNEIIISNIKQGKEQGIYRKEINEKIIGKFHLYQIEQMPYSDLLPLKEFTSEKFVSEICIFHLNGLVNEQGRVLITKYKNKLKMIYKSEAV